MIMTRVFYKAYGKILCFHEFVLIDSERYLYILESFWEENAAQDPVCHQFKLLPNHTLTHREDMAIQVEPMIDNIPRHTLVKKADKAQLNCSRISGSDHRIQWWMSINNTSPSLISDGDILLDHFNQSRYKIEQPDKNTFNLVVEDVQISDAGTYICYDGTMGGSPRMVTNQKDGFKLRDTVGEAKAELIVIGIIIFNECRTELPKNWFMWELLSLRVFSFLKFPRSLLYNFNVWHIQCTSTT